MGRRRSHAGAGPSSSWAEVDATLDATGHPTQACGLFAIRNWVEADVGDVAEGGALVEQPPVQGQHEGRVRVALGELEDRDLVQRATGTLQGFNDRDLPAGHLPAADQQGSTRRRRQSWHDEARRPVPLEVRVLAAFLMHGSRPRAWFVAGRTRDRLTG